MALKYRGLSDGDILKQKKLQWKNHNGYALETFLLFSSLKEEFEMGGKILAIMEFDLLTPGVH